MDAGEQRGQLAQIVLEEDLDLSAVWIRYFAVGGTANEEEFALYAVGEFELRPLQRDLVSIALREVVDEHREAMNRSTTRERPRRLTDHGD